MTSTELNHTDDLTVVFNGRELQGRQDSAWIECALDPNHVRSGTNTVELWYYGPREELELADVMVTFNHSDKLLENTSYINRTRDNM